MSDGCLHFRLVKPHKRIDWLAVERKELWRSCCHEAGHYLIAKHYGFSPTVTFTRTGCRNNEVTWVGRVLYDGSEATPFKKSVISWSGPLMDGLEETPPEQWKDEMESVVDYLENTMDCFQELSATDAAGIKAINTNRSRDAACKLLVKYRREITEFAEKMYQLHLALCSGRK